MTGLRRGLAQYSQLKPRKLSQVVTCGANGRIAIAGIADFDEGFINLLRVEYPIVEVGKPCWLDADDWQLYLDGESQVIRFTETIPANGERVGIHHSAAHVMPDDDDDALTVVASDMPAVVHWSAAECMQMLADFYVQSAEHSNQGADIAVFINKSQICSSRAAELRKQFWLYLRTGRARARGEIQLVRG